MRFNLLCRTPAQKDFHCYRGQGSGFRKKIKRKEANLVPLRLCAIKKNSKIKLCGFVHTAESGENTALRTLRIPISKENFVSLR